MEIIKAVYEIEENKNLINLFCTFFVKENKLKFKILCNNKVFCLKDKIKIPDNTKEKFKIKIIILDTKYLNLSHMFYECASLIELSEI